MNLRELFCLQLIFTLKGKETWAHTHLHNMHISSCNSGMGIAVQKRDLQNIYGKAK